MRGERKEERERGEDLIEQSRCRNSLATCSFDLISTFKFSAET